MVDVRDPKTNKLVTNQEGFLEFGKTRIILDFETDEENQTWGRISEDNAAGVALYVGVQVLNRTFMERLPDNEQPEEYRNLPPQSSGLEARVASLEGRVAVLEGSKK
jgi:hypothetical protein